MNRDVYSRLDGRDIARDGVRVAGYNQLRLALCADFDTTIATRLTSMERVEKYRTTLPSSRRRTRRLGS